MEDESPLEVEFLPWEILRVLNEEGVEYLVIGGTAAVLHGSSLPTQDVDILPLREPQNLERLSRALARLDAKIRTANEPVATTIDGPFLDATPAMLNLVTKFGDLDLAFAPAGPMVKFEQWNANATSIDVRDRLVVRVAALEDVIASKIAANRPKDQRALPYLESLLEQIPGKGESGSREKP